MYEDIKKAIAGAINSQEAINAFEALIESLDARIAALEPAKPVEVPMEINTVTLMPNAAT